MKTSATTRRLMLTGILALGLLTSATEMVGAEEDAPSADLTVAAYSQYLWRGWATSRDSVVIQPSLTTSYKGFSFNLWGNLDTDKINLAGDDKKNWTETDMTLSYDTSLAGVDISGGIIYYAFDGAMDTQEVYLSLSVPVLLSPTITVYRDIDHLAGWYIAAGLSHSFALGERVSLDLGGQVGYLSANDPSSYADPHDGTKSYKAMHDGLISVALPVSVNKYITISPEVYYTFPLSSDARDRFKADHLGLIGQSKADFVYGGLSLNMAF